MEKNILQVVVPVVTIDGPSGSGKGTVGWEVAQELGWDFLDSGAIYRLLALQAMRNNIPLDNEEELAQAALDLDVYFEKPDLSSDHFQIFLNHDDVTNEIRSEECGGAASKVASLKAVRKALLARQQAFRQLPGLVADGRDMGTVVFPDAPVKFFITASAEERANRRYKQLKEKGNSATLARILADIKARDQRDSERSVAPLKPAEDAVVIDTTEMTVDEAVDMVLAIIDERFQ
ncbi:MAG: (d)CMP kinase [Gammaproteobacteria bacterium]|nr:(d)CMP kinase [Gammaproteobacteria bacterium]